MADLAPAPRRLSLSTAILTAVITVVSLATAITTLRVVSGVGVTFTAVGAGTLIIDCAAQPTFMQLLRQQAATGKGAASYEMSSAV
jgi:hypothetical protein